MSKKTVLMIAICVVLLIGPLYQAAASTEKEPPQVKGWTAGLAADSVRGDMLIGARLGFWTEHLGFDARLQATVWGLELSDADETYDEMARVVLALGVKGGYQRGAAKWFGRLGGGLSVENERSIFTADERLETVLGFAELGGGVDFAVSDRLVIGLNLINARFYVGEISVGGDDGGSDDLVGGQLHILSGGHVSYQF